MTHRFTDADVEDDFIDDNGDHHLASYDREGRAYYTDRATYGALKHSVPSARAKPTKIAPKAQAARDELRPMGFKALSGTAKQKEWAEKIRREKILAMSEEMRREFIDIRSAKFWIENRNRPHGEFEAFARKSIDLYDAQLTGDYDRRRRAGEERSRLLCEWHV